MKTFSVTFANGDFSRLELVAVLHKLAIPFTVKSYEQSFCIVEAETLHNAAKLLGGSFKIGEVSIEASDEDSFMEKLVKAEMFEWLDEKAFWGLSIYGMIDKLNPEFIHDVESAITEKVREAGAHKARKVLPDIVNYGGIKEISSMLVADKKIIDLQLLRSKDEIALGVTKATIPSREFQERDLQRPYQDSMISLSPRIARMLVNLTMVGKEETLLDPFCGTGTILMEAACMGINIIGLDKDTGKIKGAIANIDWLRHQSKIPRHVRTEFSQADIKNMRILGRGSIDGIATEPILLPPLERFLPEDDAKEILTNSFKIYREFLKSAEHVLKSRAKIATVIPYVRLSTGKKAGFGIKQLLEGIDLQIVSIEGFSFPIIAKYTPDQKVIRGVLLLEKL